jgi:hypothetical protein
VTGIIRECYAASGPTLLAKAAETHGINLRETIRQWMMVAELWKDRGNRCSLASARHHQDWWRADPDRRINMVVQERGPQCALVYIDDATSRLHLQFVRPVDV